MRIGFGYDIHCFAPDRRLVLGGVVIPFELGLRGHSDADVLIHAICDALLGAAALGDIGHHFPDHDPQYKNASSLTFLRTVKNLLQAENYEITNVDATLVLERPRIFPFISDMRQAMAEALGIEIARISVKATTNEGLGAIGRLEGCAAYAVASLQPVTPDHTR
ncbi:MAG TPA: 2-C-methyl-D-erythritol 2,4-cyclodiphosphate synthase [Terriglobia bacterium]|nr:2-C-methyl-D-erythritol 2,4-cyclodiphosphate synthase [Terriglobia bacterium]